MKMVIKSIVFRIAVFILQINMNLITQTTAHSNLKFIFDKADIVLSTTATSSHSHPPHLPTFHARYFVCSLLC